MFIKMVKAFFMSKRKRAKSVITKLGRLIFVQ